MSSILVPLDGSQLATQVLPYVRTIAKLLKADVLLTHVIDHVGHYHVGMESGVLDQLQGRVGQSANTETLEALRERAAQYLEGQAAPLRAAGIEVGITVLEGPPDEVIASAGRDHDMIAMSTHGRSGVRRWAMGSVTDRVLHTSSVPVLVVRRPAPKDFELRRILVPLDGSPRARRALAPAVRLAHEAGAELALLTIIPPPIGGIDAAVAAPRYTVVHEATLRDLLMTELANAAPDYPDLKVSTTIGQGFVAEEISDEATRQEVDLIVLSSHGYSGWKRLALGSVTDKVMHTTTTPLLVVHAPAVEGRGDVATR